MSRWTDLQCPYCGELIDVVVDDSAGEDDETFFLQLHDVQGALIGTPRVTATLIDDDYTLTAIHAAQGSGERSPLEGRTVHVRGIVTGRKNNGFFLQAPDAEADNDPMTSEGVFVFTRSAPPAEAAAGSKTSWVSRPIGWSAPAHDSSAPIPSRAARCRFCSATAKAIRPHGSGSLSAIARTRP